MYKFRPQTFAPFIIFLLICSGKLFSVNLKITPSQLTFAGETSSIITRPLLLELDSTTQLTCILMDLIGPDDTKILPSSSIKLLNLLDILLMKILETTEVQVNLERIASGIYTGLILLRLKILSFPVLVKIWVKDSCFFAALVLSIGIISGLLRSYFQQQENPRNRILIQQGESRFLLKAESDMIHSFREQINVFQIEIKILIHSEKWDKANLLTSEIEKISDQQRRCSDCVALHHYYFDIKKLII